MRQSWTDDRLDDLARRMDERFDHVEGEMKAGFERVDKEMQARFAQVDARFKRVETEMKAGFAGVDARFERVETEIKAGFAGVDARFERVEGRIAGCEAQLAEIKASQDLIREAIAEMHADNRQLHTDLYALQQLIVRIGFGLVFSLVAVLGLLVTNS